MSWVLQQLGNTRSNQLVNSWCFSWRFQQGKHAVYFTCHTRSPLHTQRAFVSWRRMSTPSTRVVCKSTPLAGNARHCAWISDWRISSCYTVSEFKTNSRHVWGQKHWYAMQTQTFCMWEATIIVMRILD